MTTRKAADSLKGLSRFNSGGRPVRDEQQRASNGQFGSGGGGSAAKSTHPDVSKMSFSERHQHIENMSSAQIHQGTHGRSDPGLSAHLKQAKATHKEMTAKERAAREAK